MQKAAMFMAGVMLAGIMMGPTVVEAGTNCSATVNRVMLVLDHPAAAKDTHYATDHLIGKVTKACTSWQIKWYRLKGVLWNRSMKTVLKEASRRKHR